jgi:hypothetical protein
VPERQQVLGVLAKLKELHVARDEEYLETIARARKVMEVVGVPGPLH